MNGSRNFGFFFLVKFKEIHTFTRTTSKACADVSFNSYWYLPIPTAERVKVAAFPKPGASDREGV